MVRFAKHRKNFRGGGPPYLNVNYPNNTSFGIQSATPPPQQNVANIMRQMRRSAGIQANTPTAIEAELSRRHEPVGITLPTPPVAEKKPGFFNRLFGRTRKNTGEKKPGFLNRLFGRTQKQSGEKKPGFFNRLFGRTKKVQPLPPQPSVRPQQSTLAPTPPTPPTLPVIGPNAYTKPKSITIPRRFNLESDYAVNLSLIHI